jgi:predicted ester cyclase
MSDAVENKALFRRFMEEVANNKNLGAIDELMATDFVEHEQLPPGTPPGREAARFFFTQWRQGFPDGRARLDMEIAQGDFVVCHATWTGTHTGEFFAIPASGKSVTFTVIDIARITGGKIREHWGVADNLTLMQQIGAIPTPGQPA